MSSFKFMHAADIHLDSPLRGLERYAGAPTAQIRGATREAFVRLVDDCIQQEVDFLLLVGDLFDGSWRDYNTGLFFNAQMARLKSQGIRVFVVRGNHDAANTMTRALRLPDNVHEFSSTKPETQRIAALGVAIHGQSYPSADVSQDLSLKYPAPDRDAFNIGLLHTSADGSATEHAVYAPCNVQALVDRGYDYWALGHIHRRSVLREGPHVVFPGNLQGRHIRETGPKGATLVTVKNQKATLQERHLDVMRWSSRDISIEGARSASAAMERVYEDLDALRRESGEMPLAVRVRLQGHCDAHRELVGDVERWTNEVRTRGTEVADVWVEKVLFDTRSRIDIDALRRRASPLGELLRTLDALRDDPAGLQALVAELSPMQERFGSVDAEERPRFDRGDEIRAVLSDVEQLLIPMLLEGGEAP